MTPAPGWPPGPGVAPWPWGGALALGWPRPWGGVLPWGGALALGWRPGPGVAPWPWGGALALGWRPGPGVALALGWPLGSEALSFPWPQPPATPAKRANARKFGAHPRPGRRDNGTTDPPFKAQKKAPMGPSTRDHDSGLKSRWTRPAWWAASRPRPAWMAAWTICCQVRGAWRSHCRRVPPATYSRAMKEASPWAPTS